MYVNYGFLGDLRIILLIISVSQPSLYVNYGVLGDLRIIPLIIAASLVFQKAFFYRIIDL